MKVKIEEFKCICSGCNNLWFYTESDLAQSQRNEAINKMKTGVGLLGCVPLLFIKGQDVIDYDRCPKCGSRSISKEKVTSEIDVPFEEVVKTMSAVDAANINPTTEEEYVLKSSGLDGLHKKTEAVDTLKKGLEIYPNSHYICFGLGFLLHREGKYSDAIQYYKKGTEFCKDNVQAWNTYACCLAELNKYDEALEPIIKASELLPDDTQIKENLKIIRSKTERKKHWWK